MRLARATAKRGGCTVAAVPPEPAAAPSFRRAVVALSGNPNGQRLVRLVAEVARVHKAELIGVHVVEIDWSMPLDMDVAGRSEEIQQVLDLAEGTAEAAGVKLDSVLLQARDVGAALVDETVEREADLLVVGLAYKTKFGGDFAMGRTIPYVLKNAPCAVWVVREPIPEETS
jgi:nucleotide-binding universal stress UspA family protein